MADLHPIKTKVLGKLVVVGKTNFNGLDPCFNGRMKPVVEIGQNKTSGESLLPPATGTTAAARASQGGSIKHQEQFSSVEGPFKNKKFARAYLAGKPRKKKTPRRCSAELGAGFTLARFQPYRGSLRRSVDQPGPTWVLPSPTTPIREENLFLCFFFFFGDWYGGGRRRNARKGSRGDEGISVEG